MEKMGCIVALPFVKGCSSRRTLSIIFPETFCGKRDSLPSTVGLPRPRATKKAEPKPRLLVTISRDYFLAGSPFTFSTSRMIQ